MARFPDSRLFSVAANLDTERVSKPVHCKLVPWYRTDLEEAELIARIDDFASRYEPFTVRVVGTAKMGENNAHPVLRLGETMFLEVLHDSLAASVGHSDIRYVNPHHADANYKPHTSLNNPRASHIPYDSDIPVRELLLLRDVYERQQTVGSFALRGAIE